MVQFSLNAPDSSRYDANPWQSYSKDNSQNCAEATNSLTERTELGYIYEVIVLSDFTEHKSSKATYMNI